MNTKNNKRRQETVRNIEIAFLSFLQAKKLEQITVSDICKAADINRSTFYANFMDVYDLADKLREKLEAEVAELYSGERAMQVNSHDYLKLFHHIYNNQVLYSTYFKLGYDGQNKIMQYDTHLAEKRFGNRFIDYHIEFFRQGLNAIIKKWLAGGCKETPEEMMEIVTSEYSDHTDLC
ncbi:MAG: TetR/AcrR family transcriptional regulator [Clostridium sp.]|nr:TetR/AcrR family transcriptional regulator [Clostridium sp.]